MINLFEKKNRIGVIVIFVKRLLFRLCKFVPQHQLRGWDYVRPDYLTVSLFFFFYFYRSLKRMINYTEKEIIIINSNNINPIDDVMVSIFKSFEHKKC